MKGLTKSKWTFKMTECAQRCSQENDPVSRLSCVGLNGAMGAIWFAAKEPDHLCVDIGAFVLWPVGKLCKPPNSPSQRHWRSLAATHKLVASELHQNLQTSCLGYTPRGCIVDKWGYTIVQVEVGPEGEAVNWVSQLPHYICCGINRLC